jgi:uncharacterized protein (DUF433 family)
MIPTPKEWQDSIRPQDQPDVRAAARIPMLRGSDWARDPQVYRLSYGAVDAQWWYIECEVNGLRYLQGAVDVDPDRRGGVPLLKGTGFTVAQALAELADGSGVPELAERFNLDPEVIREILNGLSLMFQRRIAW